MERKHIGTIIDKSYFETFHRIKGNNIHAYKMCMYCMEEVELGFECIDSNGRSSGFAVTLPHECKNWVDKARHRNGALHKYILPDNGFIFEPAKIVKGGS